MGTTSPLPDRDRYLAVQDGTKFKTLRGQVQTFTLWACVAFTGWWILASLLGAFAPGFYRITVIGYVNVGLLFALGSFILVLVIVPIYLSYAKTRLDPLAEQVRADLEGEPR
jgi:uncharacterized membrane protein (DUF485 family)